MVLPLAVLTFMIGSTTAGFCPEMYETDIPVRLGVPEISKLSMVLAADGFPMTVSGIKVGMLAWRVARLGHEPGMMNIWSAVNANGPADAVRKGEEDGFLPCTRR